MESDRLVRKAGKTFTTWRPWLSIKPSANLAGLLALPCRIAEFSCVPPHNEEEKTVDPDELSTTNTKLLNNYFWQMVIYMYTSIYIYIYSKESKPYQTTYLTNYPLHQHPRKLWRFTSFQPSWACPIKGLPREPPESHGVPSYCSAKLHFCWAIPHVPNKPLSSIDGLNHVKSMSLIA